MTQRRTPLSVTQGSARSCVSIRRDSSLCHSEPLRRRIPDFVSFRAGSRSEESRSHTERSPSLCHSEWSLRSEESRIFFYDAALTRDESRQVEEQNLGRGAGDYRQVFF